jgi:hypothetical protein
MLIKYVGQYAPVVITARADLGPIDLHDVVDVDDELGILLCEQVTNWVPGDDEAQAALDDFYRWVAAHERVQVKVDDLGNTELRWVPKPTPADDPPPADDPAAAAAGDPEPTTRAARRRTGSTDPTQEG